MGIRRIGECLGCHQQKDLVVDESYCSEACKQRAHDTSVYAHGVATGVALILFMGALAGLAFHFWHHPVPEKEQALRRFESEQQAIKILRVLLDTASTQSSNDLEAVENETGKK